MVGEALRIDTVYLEKALKEGRKYVKDLGEDLSEGTPEDEHIQAAILAVARHAVDSLLQDLRWHLDDTRTGAYEVFERALLKAMGEGE